MQQVPKCTSERGSLAANNSDPDRTPPPTGEVPGPEIWGGVGEEHPPAPDVTPVPGETPDTAKTWWYVPYINRDRMQPVETLTINGITVGPDVEPEDRKCGETMSQVSFRDISDPSVAIDVSVLPDNFILQDHLGLRCGEEDWIAEAQVTLLADEEAGFRGGSLVIFRSRGRLPKGTTEIPAYRWFAGKIAGHPAAIARPILDDIGLGQSIAAIYVEGVFTAVTGFDIPLEMLIEITEAQFR